MDGDLSRRCLLGAMGAALTISPGRQLARAAGTSASAAAIIDLPTGNERISRVTHWRAPARRGTILFSHGALSSPAKYDPLILPWVTAGYDVWAPLHVDSTDHPDTRAFPGLASWSARIEDMRALSRHVGARSYVAAGHSYGALVALTLGGAAAVVPEGLSGPLRDPSARAAVAFSPPGAAPGLIDAAGYAALAVPALIQTGTHDLPPLPPAMPANPETWRAHLLAYDSAAAGRHRYALVLDGADHYFGGLICRPESPGPPQRVQLEQGVALSRLFLDGFGKGEAPSGKRARDLLDARLADTGPVQLRSK